jgi:hypothetical protein
MHAQAMVIVAVLMFVLIKMDGDWQDTRSLSTDSDHGGCSGDGCGGGDGAHNGSCVFDSTHADSAEDA